MTLINKKTLHHNIKKIKSAPAEKQCPLSLKPNAPQLHLRRVSEVIRDCEPTSTLAYVLDWVKTYLALPHPELGRKGPVCPFVPIALEQDTIWMMEIADENPGQENITAVINECRELFLTTEPTSGPDLINKAFLVIFPNLKNDDAHVVDAVQMHLKRSFVEKGLMLGEFHANNQSGGLRNPEFRPLRSPIPILAMRHMVDSDLPFLASLQIPAAERIAYLRSYLFRLGGALSMAKFSAALDGIVAAEFEMQKMRGDQIA